jgi:hypothetical protein
MVWVNSTYNLNKSTPLTMMGMKPLKNQNQ